MPSEEVSHTAEKVVELEFRSDDQRYPLVAIPNELGIHVQAEQIVPRRHGAYAVYYSFTGASPERLAETISDADSLEGRFLSTYSESGTIEVLVTNPEEHFAVALTEAGAIPQKLWSVDGVASIVAEVPVGENVSDVVGQFKQIHPTVELVAQRQTDRVVPLFTQREFESAVEQLLTERQLEVLRTAYDGGYFETPRENNGEEVAAALGINSATFYQHLQAAERKVYSLLFGDAFER